MHRIDADANVANMFDEGDPMVPRQPTQVDAAWLNAIQEEVIKFLVDAAITPVKGTWTQLRAAITALYVDKASTQTVAGAKTFSAAGTAVTVTNTISAGAVNTGTVNVSGTSGYVHTGILDLSQGSHVTGNANELQKDNIPKDWISLTLNGTSSPTVNSSYGAAVTATSSNVVIAYASGLDMNFAQNQAISVTLGDELAATMLHARIGTRQTTGVNIKLRDGAGSPQDPTDPALSGLKIDIQIMGKQ